MADDAAVTRLIADLATQKSEVRWDAAKRLGNLGKRAEPALFALETARSDRDGMVRGAAEDAIRKITDPSSAPSTAARDEYDSAWPPGTFNEVPGHRRSSTMTVFILVGFFLFPPLLWAACFICLTGDIFYNKVRKDGSLAVWSPGNKVAAVVILIVQAVAVISRLSQLGS